MCRISIMFAVSMLAAGCRSDEVVIESCGEVEFDGYSYGTVVIGEQCWFTENLRTTYYSNGDSIFEPSTPHEWLALDSAGGQMTPQLNGTVITYGRDGFPCSSSSPTLDACDPENSLIEFGRL